MMTTDKVPAGSLLVIGVGNTYRCDDGVGLEVAQKLRELAPTHIKVLEHGGEGAGLMEMWRDARAVILVDATHSGAAPGTIHRINCSLHALARSMFSSSTHAFSVADAVELSRVLGQLPSLFIVFGVEGADYSDGTELTSTVRQAVPRVVEEVLAEINKIV